MALLNNGMAPCWPYYTSGEWDHLLDAVAELGHLFSIPRRAIVLRIAIKINQDTL